MTWLELTSCDSTNDELARLASDGAPAGTVVIARTQRAGRGRNGRRWQSGQEGNLYASILLRPRLEPKHVPPISLCVGIAVVRAVRELGVRAELKWPNDIVVGTRKLGGILAEASTQGMRLEHVVVGIGLNIASQPAADAAPDRPSAPPTSLVREGAVVVPPSEVMALIAERLPPVVSALEAGGVDAIRDHFRELWRDRDRRVRTVWDGKPMSGFARDIDSTGALVVEGESEGDEGESEGESGERVAVVAGDVEIDYA